MSRRSSRFVTRIYAGYVVIILVATGLLGFMVYKNMKASAEHETERSLRSQARLLRELALPALKEKGSGRLQEVVKRLGLEAGARYTVIRADGLVVADSARDPARMENHAGRPEFLEAAARGEGKARRYSQTVQMPMTNLALRVDGDDGVLGFVRAGVATADIQEHLAQVRALVVLFASGAAAVALALGLFLARRVSRPLRSITAAAEAIADGDYEKPVRLDSRDEFGRLAEAFNRMAAALRERIQSLDRERHQVEAIIGSMVEGVIAVDQSGVIAHMNGAAARLFDLPSHRALGRPIQEVLRISAVIDLVSRVLEGRRETTTEMRTPPPRELVLELHAAPLNVTGGEIQGAVVVVHDVTRLRRLEAVRRDFVANVSHELRTPLTAIRGILETLAGDPEMEAETARRFLESARKQVQRLTVLVDDLLVLSRYENERDEERISRVDVVEVAEEAIQLMEPAARKGGIDLRLETGSERLAVRGDGEALCQMITNLLSNAVKYTGSGGAVTLSVRREGDDLLLQVVDTGVGIESKHFDRIFERFYRVDQARSRDLGGTGLGLSIVKHIAMGFGGSVGVESTPGSGSTFSVRLPLAREE